MSISAIYSRSILGLFGLLMLFIVTASSITFTAYSAAQQGVDTSIQSGAQVETDSVQIETESIRKISLATNDIIYNQDNQTLYASVPSSAGNIGNSITQINPRTGVIGSSVFVGSEPTKLAIGKDGRTLYVSLNGASSIRRFDTSTQTPGLQFSLGQDANVGAYYVSDLAVASENPNLVAVIRYSSNSSSSGIAVYDNGVQRPQIVPGYSGNDFLSFTPIDSSLEASGGYTGLRDMLVDSNGVTVLATTSFPVSGRIKYDAGRVFTSSGQVIDINTKTLLGAFSGVNSNAFVLDSTAGRIYYAVRDYSAGGISVKAFNINTFTPVGSFIIPNVSSDPTTLVRWGANGLALRTSDNQLFLIQTALIPSNEPIPTPTATPSVTPTPTPTNTPTFVRKVNLPANDLVYNEATQSIYASVASIGGSATGNTITQVNPQTGELNSSVFIGSEPNKLALADDGRTLYTRLDGANAIRRYDLVNKTPGSQFSLSSSAQFQDMSVMPGSPQTIAIAANGLSIYDNGVKRSNTGDAYSINDIEFSASPSVLYGLGGYELVKFAVNASGVSSVNSTNNLTSGYNSGMKFANGLLYTTSGQVIDPEAKRLIGTFQTGGSTVAVDSALNRAFFLNNNVLTAYDTKTFLKIGSVTLSGVTGTPTSLVRWGANGLAFRASSGYYGSGNNDSQLYIVQTELVSPAIPVPSGVQLSAPTFNAYEGNQTVAVSVTRTGDLSAASTVNYATTDGTATAGSDYTAASGTLSFAAGESSKNIAVSIINDNVYEGSETFNLTLSNPAANANLLYPNTAVITISDNDSQPFVSPENTTITEPISGALLLPITVRLSNPTTQTVTLNYATSNGTATAGSDYIATSGTLTFNPLETTKTVTVTVNADQIAENDETFFLNLSSPVNAYISITNVVITIKNYNPALMRAVMYDYDGDRKADLSVFRPSNGIWYFLQSQNGFGGMQFGVSTDQIVPADYDGDGRTDVAVFRGGTWYLQRSTEGFTGMQFGEASDIPQPADYNGDGRADLAVFRQSNGTWYVYFSGAGQFVSTPFGQAGDKPVAADYDGDGKADYAVFRPSNGMWYLNRSTAGFTGIRFGEATDKPVPADYDGDFKTDIAVFRTTYGFWTVQKSQGGIINTQFGVPTDIPAPADYDGDGKADIAVYRDNTWYLQRSLSGLTGVTFGAPGDKPIPNAFIP